MRFIIVSLLLGGTVANAQPGPGMNGGQRAQVEQQLRARMGQVVRERLGLDAQQMQRLNATNRKFDRERVALLKQERIARVGIRREIEAGENGSQDRIAALLDSSLVLERRRLDLVEAEQNELKKFLTPRQRAQYFGLQAQMRQRMAQIRRARVQRGGRGPIE